MPRRRTPDSALDRLKREAKRWLKALRASDTGARARIERATPHAEFDRLTLRDVQHALAREHGYPGWTALRAALEATPSTTPRGAAIADLVAAANRGDAARVAELLDQFPDIVSERSVLAGHTGRRSALHFAVGRSDAALVALLLERGADPNVRDDGDNATPLHFAAENEHFPIIRLLIEHGADPIGEGDYHELEAIGWATCFGTGRRDVADYLLEHGARHTVFSAVAMGDTAAIRAIAAAHADMIDRRMDRANNYRRPLHLAVVKRQRSSLAALLDLGADLEEVDGAGLTPLDQAALAGEDELTEMLIGSGAGLRLPAAIALQRSEDAERLLRDEPDALKPGGRWASLIVRAAERAPWAVIDGLIRAGASPNAVDDTGTSVDSATGYTALHAAAFFGNAAAVAALMRRGANVRARDGKYCGTPAGWADYRGHAEVRDFILAGPIDLFQAISAGLTHRIAGLLDDEPDALERPFSAYARCTAAGGLEPSFTPLEWAEASGQHEIAQMLRDRGAGGAVAAATPRARAEHQALIERFLKGACADGRISGGERTARMHDAARLLRRHPEIAADNIFAAVVAGDLASLNRFLADRPDSATARGGPREWPPLLYLCATRLPLPAASDNAVAIARALLDHGADPNAYYFGGNPSIHYTALTALLGRGEEQALTHPSAKALGALLLARGAEPYDAQVLYNVFADHASRTVLGDDIVWLLQLMYDHSVQLGRASDWADPDWKMLDVGGYRPGAWYLLGAAVDGNHLELAEWMLSHGASPNASPPKLRKQSPPTLYQRAVDQHSPAMAALLLRHGADPRTTARDEYDSFVSACMRLDAAAARAMVDAHPEYRSDHRALLFATERNRADVVELLLDLGVSPDIGAPSEGGRRALHVAAYADSVDAARVLIDRGAEVDFRESRYGGVPLGVAIWAHKPRMIELLGRFSRDVWELVYAGRVERLREVLREQPELARAANGGQTPLMWLPNDDAAAVAIAQLLLANGADPSARDEQGRTAADIAAERGMDDVARILRSGDGGANP